MSPTLGFQPRESLAIVTLRGTQLAPTLRVYLPAETVDPADYAQTVMHYVLADDAADGALMFVYTNEIAKGAKTGTKPRPGAVLYLPRHHETR